MQKPLHRSKFRRFLGFWYYRFKRFFYWHFSRTKFAKKQEKSLLPEKIFQHQTLLRRKLKEVDMWMQGNKITNLKLALQKLDGLVIEPGQVFSYWRQIGHPSKREGYVPGMILRDGNVTAGTGGGLCQLSNLIYWMTLHTPLTVIERWRHSYDVFPDSRRTQPFGSGATCSYPNIDLQIQNNTTQLFQLHLKLSDTHLIGEWRSNKPKQYRYDIIEKNAEIKMEWWGGYTRNNMLYRKSFDLETGALKNEELMAENHAIMMYEPLLEPKK